MTPHGLSDREVQNRRDDGRVNHNPSQTSRKTSDILRSNVLTPFNGLLGALFAVIVVVGPAQDALFGGVLVANTTIGVFEELRAKRALDRLQILTAATARVVRDGTAQDVATEQLVIDDIVELRPGDQIPVDGDVIASTGLEVDESLLSGESEPVKKDVGAEVLSGSYVAAGSGYFRTTRVGATAYARSLTDQARQFSLARSELRTGINRIVVLISWALIPTAVLLTTSQVRSSGLRDALRQTVAGTVAMVPEGLVLLTSLAFAAAVVRLGRSHVLVQDLPAVEALARTDVLCIDKTGTLTEGHHVVERVDILDPSLQVHQALAALAATDAAPNATMRAIGAAFPRTEESWIAEAIIPFSSARKWSGATFDRCGTWILGAPDVLLALANTPINACATQEQATRTLLLGHADAPLKENSPPESIHPVALIHLSDKVRADAPSTLRYFANEGVQVKVISGDDPVAVTAIAERAGINTTERAVDARTLPADPEALTDVMEANSLFGRVTPSQKRAMVAALQARGHVVAMTGDGVNDIPALKQADLGIAMGTGSPATRSAAQLILLSSSFSVLPSVVGEGRRVLANIERTSTLFITKTTYALFLAITVGVLNIPFPFLPRHLTLIGTLTIGLPAFFLALAPNHRRAHPGFVSRVLRLAVPAGLMAGLTTTAAYLLIRDRFGVTLMQERTTAVITLFWMGFLILALVASPLDAQRRAVLVAVGGSFITVLAIAPLRRFFALSLPPFSDWLVAVATATIMAAIVRLIMHHQQTNKEGNAHDQPTNHLR